MRRGMQSTSCGNESAVLLKPHVDDDDSYGHGDKCTGVVVVTTPGPFVCSHTRRMTPMERNYVSVGEARCVHTKIIIRGWFSYTVVLIDDED